MMTSVDTDLIRVLADPLRLRIVTLLARETLCTTHLVEETGARQTNLSNHLKVLREAGVVETEPCGRFTYYKLAPGRHRPARRPVRRPGRVRSYRRREQEGLLMTPADAPATTESTTGSVTPVSESEVVTPATESEAATPVSKSEAGPKSVESVESIQSVGPAPGAAPPRTPLVARAAAELVGTAALVAIVVGSGIQATELTQDVGVQLLANSTATVFGLGVLILLLGPVSGAHFNPVVTLAEWWTARRGGAGVTAREVAVYVPVQIVGAIAGAVLADAMFGEPLVKWSTHDRSAGHLLLGEVVATAGLILLIFGLARADRLRFAPVAVASYIGAAYWFTSSTSFANPAVTVGRAFTTPSRASLRVPCRRSSACSWSAAVVGTGAGGAHLHTAPTCRMTHDP